MLSWPFCTCPLAKVLVMSRMEEKAEDELLRRAESTVQSDSKNAHMSFKNNPFGKAELLQNNWKKMFSSSPEYWV